MSKTGIESDSPKIKEKETVKKRRRISKKFFLDSDVPLFERKARFAEANTELLVSLLEEEPSVKLVRPIFQELRGRSPGTEGIPHIIAREGLSNWKDDVIIENLEYLKIRGWGIQNIENTVYSIIKNVLVKETSPEVKKVAHDTLDAFCKPAFCIIPENCSFVITELRKANLYTEATRIEEMMGKAVCER